MVCTNNKKFYETIKMLRGHGLLRECGNQSFENKMKKKYKNLHQILYLCIALLICVIMRFRL